MRAHAWVRRMWRGEAGAPGSLAQVLLAPVEGLYRLGVAARNRRYGRPAGSTRTAAVPVISVGNLSVGGTGKTPLASWVVRALGERGEAPAIVARGYGEDELLLHRRWTPQVPVVANPDRWVGAEEAVARGATVVVLDDGFQHRRLARDLDLVLVSAEEGLPGRLLPRGPFREVAGALGRAHAVVVTRKEGSEALAREMAREVAARAPDLVVGRVHLRPGAFRRLTADEEAAAPPARGVLDEATPPVGPVLVATGVARPESVAAAVEGLGIPVVGVAAFPDHHDFSPSDLEGIVARAGGRPVVVTEKDAVKLAKLPPVGGADVRVLEQELVWEDGEEAVRALLARAIGRGAS